MTIKILKKIDKRKIKATINFEMKLTYIDFSTFTILKTHSIMQRLKNSYPDDSGEAHTYTVKKKRL